MPFSATANGASEKEFLYKSNAAAESIMTCGSFLLSYCRLTGPAGTVLQTFQKPPMFRGSFPEKFPQDEVGKNTVESNHQYPGNGEGDNKILHRSEMGEDQIDPGDTEEKCSPQRSYRGNKRVSQSTQKSGNHIKDPAKEITGKHDPHPDKPPLDNFRIRIIQGKHGTGKNKEDRSQNKTCGHSTGNT